MNLSVSMLAVLALLTASATAHADDLFTLTNGAQTISFVLPSSPTVSSSVSGEFFGLNNASFSLDGTTYFSPLEFETSLEGGGVRSNMYGTIFAQEGAQLFSGSVSKPTFILGTYDLTQDLGNGNHEAYTGSSTLTISAAATPEPSSFLLLGTGLIGAWSMARKRFARIDQERS